MFNTAQFFLQECRMTDKPRHKSAERLLNAAMKHGVNGPAELAVALDVSDQVVTNWGSRGVSADGAIRAEEIFGCPAVWILKGIVPPVSSMVMSALSASTDAYDGSYLVRLLGSLPEERRKTAYIAATQVIIGCLPTE